MTEKAQHTVRNLYIILFPATDTLTELFSKVENSVVQVTATVNITDPYGSSLGSGFVYDKMGHVLAPATNTDDIIVTCMEGADRFEGADFFDCGEGLDMTIDLSPENGDDNVIVTFQDGSAFNANLVASDPFSDISYRKHI